MIDRGLIRVLYDGTGLLKTQAKEQTRRGGGRERRQKTRVQSAISF